MVSLSNIDRLLEADERIKALTGQGLVQVAIQYDYHEIIRVILEELDDLPIDINVMLKCALQHGSPKIIKMILSQKKDLKTIEKIENATFKTKTHTESIEGENQQAINLPESETLHQKNTATEENCLTWQDVSEIPKGKIKKVLEKSRRRGDRLPLLELLSEVDPRAKGNSQDTIVLEQNLVYKLQLVCDLGSEEISSHCTKLDLIEPMLSWMGENLGDMSDGLLWSCEKQNIKLTKHLLNESKTLGIDPNVQNRDHETCFRIACSRGQYEIVELVLSDENTKGIDVNAQNDKGMNGFHFACIKSQSDIVELLLRHSDTKGIDINTKTKQGESGLGLALSKNHRKIIEIILREFQSKDIKIKTEDRKEIIEYFIKGCSRGDDIVSWMLKESDFLGIDLNVVGERALNIATHQKKVTLMLSDELVKKGITITRKVKKLEDKSLNSSRPLQLACLNGDQQWINDFSLKMEASPTTCPCIDSQNEDGNTCLHYASMMGHEPVLKRLLGTNLHDINVQNKYGDTPLHISCYWGREEAIAMLVKALDGRSINLTNSNGKTAFQVACDYFRGVRSETSVDIVKFFLKIPNIEHDEANSQIKWSQSGLRVDINGRVSKGHFVSD